MRLLQAHLNSLLLLLLTFMVVSLSALGVSTNHKWVFWLLYDMYHVCDLHCMPTMTQKIEVNTCFDKIKVILRLALSSFILVKVAHTEAARIAPKTWYLSHFFGVFGFWCQLKMVLVSRKWQISHRGSHDCPQDPSFSCNDDQTCCLLPKGEVPSFFPKTKEIQYQCKY